MQKQIVKAGQTEQYFVVSAMISYLKDSQKYEGMLLIQENGRERSRYGASDIRIWAKKKETVYRQLQQIATLYPPKRDVAIMDLEAKVFPCGYSFRR